MDGRSSCLQTPFNHSNTRLFHYSDPNFIRKFTLFKFVKVFLHFSQAARNILISGGDGYVAKVSDFGLSKTFYDNVRYKKRFRHYVPWKWMAIEYLKDACFTMKSDVWSYGVVLWEIFSLGQEPYAGKSIEEVITQIKTGYRMPCPDEVVDVAWADDVYRDVMKKCWDAGESCERMGLFLCFE